MPKILLLEDDLDLAKSICDWLKSNNGFIVDHVIDGLEAADMLAAYQYDVLVLDWNVPRLTGVQLLRQHRAEGGTTPALLLTANSEIKDKEIGYTAGVDDYLTKPFNLQELSFRLDALLRRPRERIEKQVKVGDITLDRDSFAVCRAGESIQLARKEFELLEFFMRNPGRVFSADALLQRVWVSNPDVSAPSISTTIKRIRKKMDKPGEPSVIETVFGVGFRLNKPNQ